MPPDGVEWKPHEAMLSFEEFLRLCRIMAGLGIRKIKVTGGEPLVRRGVASFIKNLRALPGIEKLTLTTNGLLLNAFLDEAETPGSLPNGINISLDALDPARFRRFTRLDALPDNPGAAGQAPQKITALLDRMLKMQIKVKINCVPVRGYNEEEILPLAALAKEKDIAVRFIELMPLGNARNLEPVPGSEVAALIEKACGALTPFYGIEGNGPAVYYSLPGFSGKIGFINPITQGFCETCNRLRVTSEGFLKPCLSCDSGLDLRNLLRAGASDAELARAITGAAAKKPHFHSFSPVYGEGSARTEIIRQHPGGMYEIGG